MSAMGRVRVSLSPGPQESRAYPLQEEISDKDLPRLRRDSPNTEYFMVILRQASRALAGTALASVPLLGAAGAYQYHHDEGTRRSLYFWSRCLPILLHYRWVQFKTRDLPEEDQVEAYRPLHRKYSPVLLEVILHLRGFYIKLGQVLSTRHDFVPQEYIDKVETLQDMVPSESFEHVKQVLESSLGMPLHQAFKSLDKEPMAAASIGQVHHGFLVDGREVAVKVMYPKVERLFRSDIETIRGFCRIAGPEHLPIIKEIEKQFMTEFDYRREARNLEMVRCNLAKSPYKDQVVVPRAYYGSKTVLIMEFLRGQKLVTALQHNVEVMAKLQGRTPEELIEEVNQREARGEAIKGASKDQVSQYRLYLRCKDLWTNAGVGVHNYLLRPLSLCMLQPKKWASTEVPLDLEGMMDLLLDVHGYQILIDGCFNGDPHPGNILLLENNKLGLVDFGQVKHLTLEQRLRLARLLTAMADKDKAAVVKNYIDMGFRTEKMDEDVIYTSACVAFDRDDRESLPGRMNIQELLEDLSRRDPVTEFPDDYVMAMRVAILLRALGYSLKYRYSTARHWSSAARALLVEYGDDVPDRLRLDERQVQALTADDGRDAGRADVAQKPQ